MGLLLLDSFAVTSANVTPLVFTLTLPQPAVAVAVDVTPLQFSMTTVAPTAVVSSSGDGSGGSSPGASTSTKYSAKSLFVAATTKGVPKARPGVQSVQVFRRRNGK